MDKEIEDDEDDDQSDFMSEKGNEMSLKNEAGDKVDYNQYKYTLTPTNSFMKPNYETKGLAIRKLQYVTVSSLLHLFM